MLQARERFVSLSEPVIVPTVTYVNTCLSPRKQEVERNAMQGFAKLFTVVGDQWRSNNIRGHRTNICRRQAATGQCFELN
jgi:hypothetical protein